MKLIEEMSGDEFEQLLFERIPELACYEGTCFAIIVGVPVSEDDYRNHAVSNLPSVQLAQWLIDQAKCILDVHELEDGS